MVAACFFDGCLSGYLVVWCQWVRFKYDSNSKGLVSKANQSCVVYVVFVYRCTLSLLFIFSVI